MTMAQQLSPTSLIISGGKRDKHRFFPSESAPSKDENNTDSAESGKKNKGKGFAATTGSISQPPQNSNSNHYNSSSHAQIQTDALYKRQQQVINAVTFVC